MLKSFLPGVKKRGADVLVDFDVEGLEDRGVTHIRLSGSAATVRSTEPATLLVVVPASGLIKEVNPISVFDNINFGPVSSDPYGRATASLIEKFIIQELVFDRFSSRSTPVYRTTDCYRFCAQPEFGKWHLLPGGVVISPRVLASA